LGWRGFWKFVRRYWRQYDLALVTQPGDRAHLMGWMVASRRSGIIPARNGSNWWKKLLLDHVVTSAGDLGDEHVVAEKVSLLAPWLDALPAQPRVVPTPPNDIPADILQQLRPGAVVLHTPSMWTYKQWPLNYFRELASGLLAHGRQVVLTGSAGPRDQECVSALLDLAPSPQLLDVSGRLNFNQLTDLFNRVALYIGPDTSVSHLAAASGVPVIAIFGPTNPMRWAPWPARPEAKALFERSALVQSVANVTVLQSKLPCVPCGRAGCEDHLASRSDCLLDIKPERVLQEALRLLDGDRSPRPS
jgi:heptosyltransferase-3